MEIQSQNTIWHLITIAVLTTGRHIVKLALRTTGGFARLVLAIRTVLALWAAGATSSAAVCAARMGWVLASALNSGATV